MASSVSTEVAAIRAATYGIETREPIVEALLKILDETYFFEDECLLPNVYKNRGMSVSQISGSTTDYKLVISTAAL